MILICEEIKLLKIVITISEILQIPVEMCQFDRITIINFNMSLLGKNLAQIY